MKSDDFFLFKFYKTKMLSIIINHASNFSLLGLLGGLLGGLLDNLLGGLLWGGLLGGLLHDLLGGDLLGGDLLGDFLWSSSCYTINFD